MNRTRRLFCQSPAIGTSLWGRKVGSTKAGYHALLIRPIPTTPARFGPLTRGLFLISPRQAPAWAGLLKDTIPHILAPRDVSQCQDYPKRYNDTLHQSRLSRSWHSSSYTDSQSISWDWLIEGIGPKESDKEPIEPRSTSPRFNKPGINRRLLSASSPPCRPKGACTARTTRTSLGASSTPSTHPGDSRPFGDIQGTMPETFHYPLHAILLAQLVHTQQGWTAACQRSYFFP